MRIDLHKPGLLRAPLIREAVARKMRYDAGTAAIAAKVFTPGYAPDYITGLLNLATGQMLLEEQIDHATMAAKRDLKSDETHLRPNWYGFIMGYRGSDHHNLAVSPDSGRFGGIPVESAPLFEASIRELFSKQMGSQDQISFFQANYRRAEEKTVVSKKNSSVATA